MRLHQHSHCVNGHYVKDSPGHAGIHIGITFKQPGLNDTGLALPGREKLWGFMIILLKRS